MPDPQREVLQSMAEELADMMGRHHPGRPAYYALMRAARAVREAAQDVGEQKGQARPKARVLPVLGTIGGDGRIAFREDRQAVS